MVDFLRSLDDDGLYTPEIKAHSLKKIRIHNYYASLFATAMKNRWPQRAYLGLYSGPGRARIEGTDEIVETTAMSSFRLADPFTKYIFVDNDRRCIDALRARVGTLQTELDVSLVHRDVSEAVPEIISAMPTYGPGNGLLSFCFIDPFSASLDFEVIRALGGRYKMDFLILLMLGRDVRTNFRRYLDDETDTRIASLIDDPGWRQEWNAIGGRPRDLIRFLLRKFDEAMIRLGYQAARPGDAHPIRIMGKNVFLYSLVFYSKDPLGQKFWSTTIQGTSSQLGFGL